MICKKHPDDFTSAVGVCASCLHERLIALMAAQVQLQLQDQTYLRSDTQLLPPRSVPRRNEEFHQRRFYSTPLAGPALVGIEPESNTTAATATTVKKNKKKSLFWGLFRSKPDNPRLDSDPGPDPGLAGHDQFYSCMASPSWFTTIIPARRRKQTRTFSLDENSIGGAGRNPCRRNRGRGMSPARCSDDEEEEDGHFRGGSSGYSSESSQGWKQTPRRTPARGQRSQGKTSGHSRNVSGLAFCLSPLVRPSPNRHWNQNGIPPEILVLAGSPAAAAFCKNRSRKIADFGRQSLHTRRR